MGDREKGFYRKIFENERVLSIVKAGVFFLASDFFRFSLFPAILALPLSGRKKLSMFRMQRPTVPIHRATIRENDWV